MQHCKQSRIERIYFFMIDLMHTEDIMKASSKFLGYKVFV